MLQEIWKDFTLFFTVIASHFIPRTFIDRGFATATSRFTSPCGRISKHLESTNNCPFIEMYVM